MRRLLPALLLPLLASPVLAQEVELFSGAKLALIGLRVGNSPVYLGQKDRGFDLRPVVALRWGRVRISNSGGSSLLSERGTGGATTDLLDDDDWRLTVGLRFDRGRNVSGIERLRELPDVRTTIRGRVGLTWHQTDTRDWTLAVNPDLLGRGGGLLQQFSMSQRLPEWGQALPMGGKWTALVSLAAADRRYQRSYFGVPSGLTSFQAYEPGAGLRSLTVGLTWQREFGRHWVGFGGGSLSHLLGPAADAPFIERNLDLGLNAGLAYRF